MIKELINDIAYDKISLSQALTRAKLVANKIKNDNFKNWLKKELEGYEFNDFLLPKYRKIWAPIFLTAEFPFGRSHKFPVLMPDETSEDVIETINYHVVKEPISIIEEQIKSFENASGHIHIPPQQVESLASLYHSQIDEHNGVVRKGTREVGKAQFQNIIELTKQNLLDTLMELENEFPNLINDYQMTKENNEKVQNIITNNIYGDNNPMNIAAGDKVEQMGNTISITNESFEKLKSLGVDEHRIDELKVIISEKANDKKSHTSKVLKWLGSVSASVAAKGLYENIPAITEFVQSII